MKLGWEASLTLVRVILFIREFMLSQISKIINITRLQKFYQKKFKVTQSRAK